RTQFTPCIVTIAFFFSIRRRHTIFSRDWSSDVCFPDLCDKLSNSPELLAELESTAGELPRRLQPHCSSAIERFSVNEQRFRWDMNEDAMATEKLADEIGRASCRERV